ncbi:MAG TPA: DUF177 domain-containing protein [Candidatus Polarisedimenticolia bacterium]|nr:DUF177 domain-containing protein [Candidatus Polarisedimenticolia bacterium]
MYIEIKEIGPEGLMVDRYINGPSLPLQGNDKALLQRVRITGELFRDDGDVSFTGDIGTVATLSCSRCLEPYALPLDLHFDLLYTTDLETIGEGESRVNEDQITLTHYAGERIDLGELLREQIYLGLPLKPLCRTECRGLCSRCGTNLNETTCTCREERAEDPRLLVLKKLL